MRKQETLLAALLMLCVQHGAALADDGYAKLQHWTYSTQHDDMRDETTIIASVISLNKADLPFPYQGGSHAIFGFSKTLHKSGYAKIALLSIEKGQFSCPLTCTVAVKLDNGPVENFRGHATPCGTLQCLGLIVDKGKPLPERLLTTKKLIVELPLYDFGPFQFAFNTEGLKWTDSADHQ